MKGFQQRGYDLKAGFTVIAIGLLFSLGACAAKKEPPKGRPPVPVTAATSLLKTIPVQIRSVGNVEPYNTVSIKAQVNGQIAKVHFKEGEDVRKGDLLFTIDTRPFEAALKQAEATLAKDQAQAKFAKEQARRYSGLLKDGIVTQDQYDQLRANAEAYEATIAADKAAVDNAKVQLSYCFIRSPIDGRTGNLMVQIGNLVKANDVPILVTINQVTPVYVTFSVPEKELLEIKKYLSLGKLKVEASIPNDPKGPETGVISFLDNTVDTATGTIKLKGTFPNQARRLWPGQFANVSLTLYNLQNAVVVPSTAVQTGQQGQFVFTIGQDGTAELRPVVAGITFEGWTVISQGVKPDESVVTDGQMRLAPGAKVEVKKPGQSTSPQNGDVTPGKGTAQSVPAKP